MEPINKVSLSGEESGEMRVQDMVNYFRGIEVLHPIVSLLYQSSEDKEIFQQCLSHEYEIIHKRSPVLAENEISIVQKAFMILMETVEDDVGAIEIYVEEILGLNLVSDPYHLQTLQTAVKTRKLLLESMR